MGLHVEAAVTALYTYARALRNAQTDKCGAGASGLCRELAEMRQFEFLNSYVKDVDFTFSKQERIPSLASSQVKCATDRTVRRLVCKWNVALCSLQAFLGPTCLFGELCRKCKMSFTLPGQLRAILLWFLHVLRVADRAVPGS